jgi:tellurite resistance protein
MSRNTTGKLLQAEAFATVIVFAAIADGILVEEEKDIIVNVLRRMKIFKDYRGDIKQLILKSVQSLRENPPEEVLREAIASLSPELHETAFAVAVDIIMSDGIVTEREQKILDLLADKLSVKGGKIMSRTTTSKLLQAEAFASIIVFAAIADGTLVEEEKDIIVNVLQRMKIFKDYQILKYYREDMKQLIVKSIQSFQENSPEEVLSEAIASLSPELHETAFAVAVDVIMSDGVIRESEQKTLDLLANKLSVTKDTINKITEVMSIKNRG